MTSAQQQTIAECNRHAQDYLSLAHFVKDRCARFSCLCIHDGCRIHVYDAVEAHAEFGADGWQHEPSLSASDDRKYFTKRVGPVTVSYWEIGQ